MSDQVLQNNTIPMLISFTDPVILKTTPDSKMVNSWHATIISGILHVNFTFMCAQCCFFFCFVLFQCMFEMFDS